jgi:hypothetical protein
MDEITHYAARRKQHPFADNNSWAEKEILLNRTRHRELNKLARSRYPDGQGDYELPETKIGMHIALAILTHRAKSPSNRPEWLFEFCRDRAPWLDPDAIHFKELYPRKAEELGHLIQLRDAERDGLKIRTIAPCDLTPAERKAKKRKRDRERRSLKRRAAGAIPRAQYLAQSKSRSQPWLAEGISRRTWERQRRKLSHVGRE